MAELEADETASTFIIESLHVVKTVTDCDTITRFEYKDYKKINEETGDWGVWEIARENTFLELFLDDADDMYVKLTFSQKDYLTHLVYDFAGDQEDWGSVMVETRFVTEDTANRDTIQYDYFEVTFLSSAETEADFCQDDVDSLYIVDGTAMVSDRTYEIKTEVKEQQFFVTTEIAGF
jgi:hypothetical protein